MNFQWILLAILLASLIRGISRAFYRPMRTNFLRLLCVPASFIITLILQLTGLFQAIAAKVIGLLNWSELIAMMHLESIFPDPDELAKLLVTIVATLITPMLFVAVFSTILAVLRVFYVKVLEKQIDLLNAKKTAGEAVANLAPVKGIKKFFRDIMHEDSDKRSMSLVMGAVSSFLILGILLMPIFYYMDVFAETTNDYENMVEHTENQENPIVNFIGVIDKNIVSPYENSLVVDLYSNVGMIDLTNSIVRAGGRLLTDDGNVYADDVMRGFIFHGVALAADVFSNTVYEDLDDSPIKEFIEFLAGNPYSAPILYNSFATAMDMVKDNDIAQSDGLTGEILGMLISHYQDVDDEDFYSDVSALADIVVVMKNNGYFARLANGSSPELLLPKLLEDEKAFPQALGAISKLSAFEKLFDSALGYGMNTLGELLTLPEDDAAAYDLLIAKLVDSKQINSASVFDINAIKSFAKTCAVSGKSITAYKDNNKYGFSQFVAYMAYWTEVQKAFAYGMEDDSLGYFTIEIDNEAYIYDGYRIFKLDPASDEYKGKASPIADLIHYVAMANIPDANSESIATLLGQYNGASKELAITLASKEAYVARGAKCVTVEKMTNSINLDSWNKDSDLYVEGAREKDGKLCVTIIMEMLNLMDTLGAGNSSSEDTAALLDKLGDIGDLMDLMAQTTCMKELPSMMLEGLSKYEQFGSVMHPSIVANINQTVEESNGALTYGQYMRSFASTVKIFLENIGGAI